MLSNLGLHLWWLSTFSLDFQETFCYTVSTISDKAQISSEETIRK